jgi:hypothetical protein
MKGVFAIGSAAVAALALGASCHARPLGQACTPKNTTVNGHPAQIECGPAKATVHYGATTMTYTGGTCTQTGTIFSLYIGTRVTGASSTHLFFAFGSVSKDGSYDVGKFSVGFQGDGFAHDLHTGTTTLSQNLHHGTFRGTTILLAGLSQPKPGKPISGTFCC